MVRPEDDQTGSPTSAQPLTITFNHAVPDQVSNCPCFWSSAAFILCVSQIVVILRGSAISSWRLAHAHPYGAALMSSCAVVIFMGCNLIMNITLYVQVHLMLRCCRPEWRPCLDHVARCYQSPDQQHEMHVLRCARC